MGKSNKNKRNKKYVTNRKEVKRSSAMNTWILIAVTAIGASVVIYLS
ncbi:hypothetical protein ABMA70_03210 [Halobacteriovorax sp. XZX-3]|nr:hypothetical protein [Halobacteriovorax sp. DA5]